MKEITQKEWQAKHNDFKSIGADGIKRILKLDPETGATILIPVKIKHCYCGNCGVVLCDFCRGSRAAPD